MSTHQQPPSQPEIPAELWMLWMPRSRRWVVSIDDAPGGKTCLVAFSEVEARVAATHQQRTWLIDCIPVRVK